MPPRRSSSRTQQPAQRRPRTDRACNFCRIAKLRCEPTEYGTNDRPCRRCVSQDLDCSLPRAARSQSPGSGLGVQGGPIQHPIVPQSTSGATRELTPGFETNVQSPLQQSGMVGVPMGRWPPPMMHPEGRGSSTTLHPGQIPLQTPSFLPAAPTMEGYQQSFPNVAQGSNNPGSSYFPQDYYGQTTPCNTYIASYATQSASDDAPNLGYALDPQLDNAGTPVSEQNASPPHSGEP